MAYATVAELRALEGLGDTTLFPDAIVQSAVDYAVEVIETYTGAAFEPKPFRVSVAAAGREPVFLRGVIGPRTLTGVKVDGQAQALTGWVLDPDLGEVQPPTYYGGRLVLEGTASVTPTVPVSIAWATRTLARQWLLDLHSRVPDRALSVQNDFGQVQLAQAGGSPDRPTSLPDVNAVLNRHRHRPPTVG